MRAYSLSRKIATLSDFDHKMEWMSIVLHLVDRSSVLLRSRWFQRITAFHTAVHVSISLKFFLKRLRLFDDSECWKVPWICSANACHSGKTFFFSGHLRQFLGRCVKFEKSTNLYFSTNALDFYWRLPSNIRNVSRKNCWKCMTLYYVTVIGRRTVSSPITRRWSALLRCFDDNSRRTLISSEHYVELSSIKLLSIMKGGSEWGEVSHPA